MDIHKWEDIEKESDLSEAQEVKISELKDEMRAEQLVYTLGELRRFCDVTQTQLAQRLGRSQVAISNAEKANDNKLSTIKKVVEALGATLELNAVIDGKTIPLATETEPA